jgi:uncharacterized lipoprotein
MTVMKMILKLCLILSVSAGVVACGGLDSVKNAFPDQKEAYKKSHELPALEVPPGFTAADVKDEYDGAGDESVSLAEQKGDVKVTPLGDSKPAAEFVEHNNGDFLLVRDSLRNVWRKTIKALDDLDYDIEDKNREKSAIYLNIYEGDGGMLSAISFWGGGKKKIYIIGMNQGEDGVVVQIRDENKKLAKNDTAKRLYDDLLKKLGA